MVLTAPTPVTVSTVSHVTNRQVHARVVLVTVASAANPNALMDFMGKTVRRVVNAKMEQHVITKLVIVSVYPAGEEDIVTKLVHLDFSGRTVSECVNVSRECLVIT